MARIKCPHCRCTPAGVYKSYFAIDWLHCIRANGEPQYVDEDTEILNEGHTIVTDEAGAPLLCCPTGHQWYEPRLIGLKEKET